MAQSLTRWQPFSELADLRSRMDRMFADLADGGTASWTPAIDVEREDGTLSIHADVPGVRPDEIEIDVANDVLTISGEHEETSERKEKSYVRRERRYGSFSRSIALPAGVDASRIEARSHDGVLDITVPLPRASTPTSVRITPEPA